MRKHNKLWLKQLRGWAAGLLAATSPFALGSLQAAESYYLADAQPAPAAAAPAPETAEAPAPAACDACAEEEEEGAPDYFTLAGTRLGTRLQECRGVRIYGNMAASLTFNPNSPVDRFNGPVTWTDRSNEAQLNQLWFGAEKATDGSDGCWDIGGKIDTMYGTNARFCTAAGFENSINSGQSFYGIAVPNMYAEVAKNDLKVKVGRFASPVGYFGIDTTGNFFNALPITYQYGEPFTHTGALATWTANDHLTVASGVTRGWDNWDGTGFGAQHLGWIGMATITGNNDGAFTYFGHWSKEPNELTDANNNVFSSRYVQSLVYTKKLTDKLNYVFQSDYGTQLAAKANGQNAEWYGVNQYLFWQQNDCWTWGANFEWFRDDDGFRVGTLLPALPGSDFRGLPAGRNGYIGDFYQITVGPKWQPRENLFVRPNLRWDWFEGTLDGAKNTAGQPFDDGNKDNQFIFATDVYFTF
jgi:Putative beta-barrel porin-2, OmpL-like. bbp2